MGTLALAVAIAGCGGDTSTGAAANTAAQAAPVEKYGRHNLTTPIAPELNERAPKTFRVRFETSKGDFVVEAHRPWAPNGVDRFYNLVRNHYFDETRFFRVLRDYIAQWGIHGDPEVASMWDRAIIKPDKPVETNTRGRLSFAMKPGDPGSRTTQIFVNIKDNTQFDGMAFAPFAEIVEGVEVIDELYAGYGDSRPTGAGPKGTRIVNQGNRFLKAEYPKLDYVKTARLVEMPAN